VQRLHVEVALDDAGRVQQRTQEQRQREPDEHDDPGSGQQADDGQHTPAPAGHLPEVDGRCPAEGE
jgi:hypothetical protein